MSMRWMAMLSVALTLGVSGLGQGKTVTYIHTDALGSPVLETNQAGVVVRQVDYRAYGEEVMSGPQEGPGYTGHYRDLGTGLVYMQQRYYDPVVGRFLSADPMPVNRDSGSNFNRFAYADNKPYRYLDPDGRCPTETGSRLCIHAERFDPSRSSGRSAAGTPETDSAVRSQGGAYKTSPGDTEEPLGSLNRQPDGTLKAERISGATTGLTRTARTAAGRPPENAEAIIHGHLTGSLTDDPASIGDADPLETLEVPNYAVAQDGRSIVHEVIEGRYQVRMIEGRMTQREIRHFKKVVNDRQEGFYDK